MEFFILKQLYYFFGFLLIVIFYFKYKKKLLTKSCYYLSPYLYVVFFATFFELFFLRNNKGFSLYWIRFYDFIEYYSILYFFYKELRFKKFYMILSIVYLILYVYLSFSWNYKTVGDLPIIIFTTLMVLISSVLWFVRVFQNFEETPLYKRSSFYFVSALLIYVLGTSVSFISTDYIWKNSAMNLKTLSYLILFFNLLNRLIISITLLRVSNKQ